MLQESTATLTVQLKLGSTIAGYHVGLCVELTSVKTEIPLTGSGLSQT